MKTYINIGRISDKKLDEKMDKPFNISSVCREDLTRFISKKKAQKLTNEQMKRLASIMGDVFCDCCYWDAMETWLEDIK